jgi:polyphosphate:AMP phosphotransferase
MFETAELDRKLSKKDYEAEVPGLRTELLRVQNELREKAAFSVVVIIGGVDGAGKGETVNRLHEWMDPRWLHAVAFTQPSDEEAERPPHWRFIRVLPPRGRVGIFFGSWYTEPIIDRVFGRGSEADLDSALSRINQLEKALTDDGTLVLKYWFHLSKDAQTRRIKKLRKDPNTAWRVTARDLDHFAVYDRFRPVCERALRETSTGEAPWTLIEGTDRRWREIEVGRHLLNAIETHAQELARRRPRKAPAKVERNGGRTILDTVDLERVVEPAEYKLRLAELQRDLALLSRKAQSRGISTALVFEGWDAAGKGGAIRRVTQALDARQYQVIPIAAPSDEEKARHYTWRFWRHLPRAGQVVIFDRSWYGRVLVERVENYCSEAEWMRSYGEINAFEEAMHEHGMALAKFWLHVSKDEQGRRFAEREKTPWKRFKITEEDYRNRERWDDYAQAINDMVERTSTDFAPWTLIAANDKRAGRLQVLETCCQALRQALKREKKARKKA